MTTPWNVLSRFRQLLEIFDEEAEQFLPLCVVNLHRIKSQLRDDVNEDDVRITEAAAALTYYDYTVRLSSTSEDFTSFRAGDITVSKTTSSLTENAEKIKRDALLELTPLMRDTNFVFLNV
ncbi:MAG: hypothetical protein E7555_05755 [Ruminococcaceae bacterium]|nr:hypothetical protein [Oscillospiraceae bacterium]